MRVLVDTNILARAAQLTHSMSASASQITHILTLDPLDFQGFAGISVLTPTDVLAAPTTP